MNISPNKLVGKKVIITDQDSIYYGEWGQVMDYDGKYYYIAIAQDKKNQVIFDRDQFRVSKQ